MLRFSGRAAAVAFFLTLAWLAPAWSLPDALPAPAPDTRTAGAELLDLAARTWQGLVFSQDPVSGLPADHVWYYSLTSQARADYTTPTNLGLFLMSLTAAHDLGLLNAEDEEWQLERLLAALEKIPRSGHGLFYNYFKTRNGEPDPKRYVSSVDNAWLAAGLRVVARSASQETAGRAQRLYDAMDFSVFYDDRLGQLRLGYSDPDGAPSEYHYGLLCSEARVLSVLAIAKAQAPKEHWARLYRTLPSDWTWQSQQPKGEPRTLAGREYFSGYYTVNGVRIVPSWGGSLFEFLMPLLVIPELEVAPQGLGENDRRAAALQKRYCLQQAGYPVWGLSPCATAADLGQGYAEAGVPQLGSKGYPDLGLVTPHASFLALDIDPQGVLENFHVFRDRYHLLTPLGLLDSVDVKTGVAARRFLVLDQAMIFLAVYNHLTNGKTRQRFFSGELAEALRPLLAEERFY